MDLAAFLIARLDEDERLAREAIRAHEPAVERFVASRSADLERLDGETAADWEGGTTEDGDSNFWCGVWAGDIVSICKMDDEYDTASAEHIARHDPARVLAEVEAKRRIVAIHSNVGSHGIQGQDRHCIACQTDGGFATGKWPCETLRLLALPHVSHPDCDQSWADVTAHA